MLKEKLPEIKGLFLLENFIDQNEEKVLIEKICQSEWNTSLQRRTQHYGYEYDYSRKNLATKTTDIPEWALPLKNKIEDYINENFKNESDEKGENKFSEAYHFDQLIINEYIPGQGISPHIDNQYLFDDIIVSVSLSTPVEMVFSLGDKKEEIWLARRSALIIKEDARNLWKHSITSRKSDRGHKRGVRYSLTFRKMKKLQEKVNNKSRSKSKSKQIEPKQEI